MSALTEFAGNYGQPATLEFKGKTFHFKHIDLEILTALEMHLYDRALRALKAERDALAMPDEVFERKLQAVRDKYDIGQFCFEGKEGQEFIKTPTGILWLAAQSGGCDKMELFGLMTERKEEVVSIIKQMLLESFPGLKAKPKP